LLLLPKPCGKEAGSLALDMLLPVGNLGRMDPLFACKLVEALLPVERFERHAGLELCTIPLSLGHHLRFRLHLRDTATLP
jgi:hypothetical protein